MYALKSIGFTCGGMADCLRAANRLGISNRTRVIACSRLRALLIVILNYRMRNPCGAFYLCRNLGRGSGVVQLFWTGMVEHTARRMT